MTIEQLETCKKEAKRLWLDGWYLLFNTDTETCLRVCNGIGAYWMGKACNLLDWLLPTFVVASTIHDIRYHLNAGERSEWDDEFALNCRMLLYDKYGFWHPFRWLGVIAIAQLRTALATFGEVAWKEAGKRFTEVE